MEDRAVAFRKALEETVRISAREYRYHPGYLVEMVQKLGAVEAVRHLLRKEQVSEGFTKLYSLNRLDLTVEALVLDKRFQPLFSLEERQIAWRRLRELGYPAEEPKDAPEPAAAPGRAVRGSRRHLQDLVNRTPEYLNCLLLSASLSLRAQAEGHPTWVSPLEADGYREYQDRGFLERVDLAHLAPSLSDFWPSGGPVWDGLATVRCRNGERGVILLEAKAHTSEALGPGCRAADASRERIARSLDSVKRVLGAPADADWMGAHYQYANRLAHLNFLNLVAHVPAWYVSLCFVGDSEMGGPATVQGWEETWRLQREALALAAYHLLAERIITVCAPVPVAQ